jgi:hypothetical protein
MSNHKHDFIKALALAATFALSVGCGPVSEQEDTAAPELEAVEQNADTQLGIEDMIGGLDRAGGVLYAESSSVDLSLRQLAAVRQVDGSYITTDVLTGEKTKFTVRPIAYADWLRFWKLCPNGQWVPSWATCPTLIVADNFTRVWKNAACNRKVQSAGWGTCFNTAAGGSYRFQYYEAWKCGRGTGFCVERRAVRTVRYDYDLAACNPTIITGVAPVTYDFLCKP